jgi:SnoaL-like domain
MAAGEAPAGTGRTGPGLAEQEESAIEQACTKLYHRMGVAADSNLLDFLKLFTTDVVWARPSMVMRGHDEIRAFLTAEAERTASHLTRHLYTTIVIDVIDAEHASGRAYATIYRDENPGNDRPVPMQLPELVVDYNTRFAREDGQWKISRHTANLSFSRHA